MVLKSNKVAIIVPIYNVNNYLYECLDSISKLKVNKEVILIDDRGSEDPTPIINKFIKLPSFKVYKNKENLGLGQSRNEGMKRIAKDTTHVMFVDSDDKIIVSNFENDFKKLRSNESRLCIKESIWKKNGMTMGDVSGSKHLNGVPFSASTSFWDVNHLIPFWLKTYEDAPWTLTISLKKDFKFTYTDLPQVAYRMRLSSITNSKSSLCKLSDYLENKDYCRKLGSKHPALFRHKSEYEKFYSLSYNDRKKIVARMPEMKLINKNLIRMAMFMQKISFFNSWSVFFNRRNYFK